MKLKSLFLLLLVSCAMPTEQTTQVPEDNRHKQGTHPIIAIIGDSRGQNYGVIGGLPNEVYNFAVGGKDTEHTLTCLDKVQSVKPQVLLLFAGVNDAYSIGTDQFKINLGKIATFSSAIGARLIVMRQSVAPGAENPGSEALKSAMDETMSFYYLPCELSTGDWVDGVHFSPHGYAVITDALNHEIN